MAGTLVYALHNDEGEFNKNSLGALSEAAKLAGELGTEAAAVVVGDVADDWGGGLGAGRRARGVGCRRFRGRLVYRSRRIRSDQVLPLQGGTGGPRAADRRR